MELNDKKDIFNSVMKDLMDIGLQKYGWYQDRIYLICENFSNIIEDEHVYGYRVYAIDYPQKELHIVLLTKNFQIDNCDNLAYEKFAFFNIFKDVERIDIYTLKNNIGKAFEKFTSDEKYVLLDFVFDIWRNN